MKEVYVAIIALVAMMAVVTGEPIPTSCPPIDPIDRTIHLRHETDCTKFYKCLYGEKHVMDCPFMDKAKTRRLHFNPELQVCDWPWNVTCSSSSICPPTGYTRVRHESRCDLYYSCQNGIATTETCSAGLHFNDRTKLCDSPDNANCPYREVECSGPFKAPHESDCELYYACVNNRKQVQRCPGGQHFNVHQQQCMRPEDAHCELVPTEPPPTKPPPGPVECVGNFKAPHPTNCAYYYQCQNGKKVLQMCPIGQHFNPFQQQCMDPKDAHCGTTPTEPPPTKPPPGPVECVGNFKAPHPTNCAYYYQCQNGKKVLQMCPIGQHFNAFQQQCMDPKDAHCGTTPTQPPPTKPPPGPVECVGDFKAPHATNCAYYYQCQNSKKVLQMCPIGQHFNAFQQQCMDPKDAHCGTAPPQPTPGPVECVGDFKAPHATNCAYYYQCQNGKKVLQMCPIGQHFNAFQQQCMDPKDAHCVPGSTLPPPTRPPPTATPSPAPPAECTGNFKAPHEANCGLYYECQNGKRVLRICPTGLHFNPFQQQCMNPQDANCATGPTRPPPTATPPPGTAECVGNFKAPHESACEYYYQCVNGKKVLMRCPAGQHFSAFKQMCTDPSEAHCPYHSTPDVTDTTASPNPPVTSPGNSRRCPPAGSNMKVLLYHECRCDMYYRCDNGEQIRESCPAGQHFDHIRNICDDIAVVKCIRPIPNSPPTAITDPDSSNPTMPATITPQPPATPSPTPPATFECPADGIVKFPHETQCNLFYRCVFGEKKLSKCPKGLQYDRVDRICNHANKVGCIDGDAAKKAKHSSMKAVDSFLSSITAQAGECPVDGSRNNHFVAHECFCNNYYGCEDGVLTLKRCPGNFHYDPEHEECKLPHESKCVDLVPSPSSPVGAPAPSDNDEEEIEDVTEASVAATTGDPATCIGTCPDKDSMDFTVLLPNIDCTKFCMCTYGQAYVVNCPAGLHFSRKDNVCARPQEAECISGVLATLDEDKSSVWANIPFLGKLFK